MTTYAVLNKNSVAATDNRALNRSAVCSGSDLQNGSVFRLASLGTASGYTEVWTATVPSLAAGTGSGLWMAATPHVNITFSGNYAYKGLNDDPRNFYNPSGSVIDAFKPQASDIILMTGDGITGSPSTGDYVVPAEGSFKLAWSATAPTAGSMLCFVRRADTYVSIGSGAIDSQRVTAYKLECLFN